STVLRPRSGAEGLRSPPPTGEPRAPRLPCHCRCSRRSAAQRPTRSRGPPPSQGPHRASRCPARPQGRRYLPNRPACREYRVAHTCPWPPRAGRWDPRPASPILLESLHRRRLPGAVEDLLLRPPQPHEQVELVLGGRQPVRLLVLARRLVLDVERQRAFLK